jgi:hypothetical protein
MKMPIVVDEDVISSGGECYYPWLTVSDPMEEDVITHQWQCQTP